MKLEEKLRGEMMIDLLTYRNVYLNYSTCINDMSAHQILKGAREFIKDKYGLNKGEFTKHYATVRREFKGLDQYIK